MVPGQLLRRSQRAERRGKRPLFAVENIESVVTVVAGFAALALAVVALAATRAESEGAVSTKTVTETVTVSETTEASTAPERARPNVVDPGSAGTEAAPAGEERYVVRPGDTLWGIASRHYADAVQGMKRIKRANRLKRDKVLAGETLVLPAAGRSSSR